MFWLSHLLSLLSIHSSLRLPPSLSTYVILRMAGRCSVRHSSHLLCVHSLLVYQTACLGPPNWARVQHSQQTQPHGYMGRAWAKRGFWELGTNGGWWAWGFVWLWLWECVEVYWSWFWFGLWVRGSVEALWMWSWLWWWVWECVKAFCIWVWLLLWLCEGVETPWKLLLVWENAEGADCLLEVEQFVAIAEGNALLGGSCVVALMCFQMIDDDFSKRRKRQILRMWDGMLRCRMLEVQGLEYQSRREFALWLSCWLVAYAHFGFLSIGIGS